MVGSRCAFHHSKYGGSKNGETSSGTGPLAGLGASTKVMSIRSSNDCSSPERRSWKRREEEEESREVRKEAGTAMGDSNELKIWSQTCSLKIADDVLKLWRANILSFERFIIANGSVK